MASRNAACLSQARWCVDAGHLVDCVQRVGARGGAVGKSLSLGQVNNFSQREYVIPNYCSETSRPRARLASHARTVGGSTAGTA